MLGQDMAYVRTWTWVKATLSVCLFNSLCDVWRYVARLHLFNGDPHPGLYAGSPPHWFPLIMLANPYRSTSALCVGVRVWVWVGGRDVLGLECQTVWTFNYKNNFIAHSSLEAMINHCHQ